MDVQTNLQIKTRTRCNRKSYITLPLSFFFLRRTFGTAWGLLLEGHVVVVVLWVVLVFGFVFYFDQSANSVFYIYIYIKLKFNFQKPNF